MSKDEARVQSVVHSLESGMFAQIVQAVLGLVVFVLVALLYLFFQFRGLATADGMEQAQIARELARGNGLSTKSLAPLALAKLHETTGRLPAGNVPDLFHAPLGPLVNAAVFRLATGELLKPITSDRPVYSGDRLVAAVAIGFFLAALFVLYALGSSLFDRRVAFAGVVLIFLADQFWQFALSGLPQMLLLFLFSCALLWFQRALRAQAEGQRSWFWLLLLGLTLGLLALTHPITLWLSAGLLLACAGALRPRVFSALLPTLLCGGVFALWLLRNYQVAHVPAGVAWYAPLQSGPHSLSSLLRATDPVPVADLLRDLRSQMISNFHEQLASFPGLLGGVLVAPVFLVALFHRFRRSDTEAFKWSLLVVSIFAAGGVTVSGLGGDNLSPNQIYLLLGPPMVFFGFAFLLVLLTRLGLEGRIYRGLLLLGLGLLTAFPGLLGFISRARPVHYPPYLPGFVQLLGTWNQPQEILVSDMPWAVAWYADRKCLWLPNRISVFNDYLDFQPLGGPLVGLYVTPVSRDRPYLSDLRKGEYEEWGQLLELAPAALDHFPFRAVLPVAGGDCLYFSDRDRWRN